MATMVRHRTYGVRSPNGRVIFPPHTGYKQYRMPLFIVHASDRWVDIRSELGDMRIHRLDELKTTHRVIYACVDPDELCLYGDPTMWEIRTWNNRVSSMEYAGVKIYPLLTEWDDDVWSFFALLDEYGVAASSLNTMSLNLWRTTLSSTVSFHEQAPLDAMLGPVSIHTGGRKEAKRGVYRNRVEYDITAAYPNALADAMPTRLTPAPDGFLHRMDITKWEGIATARVRIPPMEWGPLPVVLDMASEVTCYGYTKPDAWVTVTVPLSELRTVANANVDYVILRCNVGIDYERAFDDWLHEIVPRLRSLPALSGTVGKLVANRLWSSFAVAPYGVRREHRFTHDGTMLTTVMDPDPTGQVLRRAATTYVGAIVQSRVRQRLWVQGLNGPFRDIVYIDTDGVIARPSSTVPDGWRAKTVMRHVDIAGPQAVYYTCPQCLPPPAGHAKGHWTVAGAQSVEAKSRLFRLMKHGGMVMTNINNVLPSQDVNAYATTQGESETDTVPPALLPDDTSAHSRRQFTKGW